MDLIKKIYKKSAVILIILAALSCLIEPKRLPAGIIVGGLLALLNIKGLAWGIEGLIGTEKAKAKMLFLSQFRLIVLFAIITAIVYLRIVNVFGLLAGLTVVFALILIEGYKHSKKVQMEEASAEGNDQEHAGTP